MKDCISLIFLGVENFFIAIKGLYQCETFKKSKIFFVLFDSLYF